MKLSVEKLSAAAETASIFPAELQEITDIDITN
jgi:hypothetical protein